jgi:hypothetical protein
MVDHRTISIIPWLEEGTNNSVFHHNYPLQKHLCPFTLEQVHDSQLGIGYLGYHDKRAQFFEAWENN